MLAGDAPTGEVLRAVVMPMAADEAPKKGDKPAPFPAEFDPATAPSAPAVKSVVTAASERLNAAKDQLRAAAAAV
jgi:hypothetical protein